MHSRSLPANMCNFILFMLFSITIVTGMKTFSIGAQEAQLLGKSPLYLLENFHIHALRYLIVWPSYLVSNALNANFNKVYAFYVLFLTYLTSLCLGKTLKLLSPHNTKNPSWYRSYFFALWLIILLFMNGRLISEFLGMSLILYAQTTILYKATKFKDKISYRCLGLQTLGLLFSSVSSASFSVAFCEATVFCAAFAARSYSKEHIIQWKFVLINTLILIAYLPYQAEYLAKNACYFSAEIAGTEVCRTIMPLPDQIPSEVKQQEQMLTEKAQKSDEVEKSYSDFVPQYAGTDDTLQKALIHGPVHQLNILWIGPLGEKGISLLIAVAGLALVGFSLINQQQLGLNVPLLCSIGFSACVGIFGIKAVFMMFPAVLLFTGYHIKSHLLQLKR